MKVTMKFEGGKDLAAALSGLPARVSKRILLESLTEAAAPLVLEMEDRAPRDRGQLAEAMTVGRSRAGEDSREAVVAVGATRRGFYGSFQEFGTAHVPPQPWARPAFDATWQQCLQVFARALWGRLAVLGVKGAASRTTFGGADAPAHLEGEV